VSTSLGRVLDFLVWPIRSGRGSCGFGQAFSVTGYFGLAVSVVGKDVGTFQSRNFCT